MRLLLARSSDGFLARGPDDDMRWTGQSDKAAFRLLTLSNGNDVLLAGSRTFDQMPKLPGRQMERLSRKGDAGTADSWKEGTSLEVAAACWPDAWLIGGPTVAAEALRAGLVRRAFIMTAPVALEQGIRADEVMNLLPEKPEHSIKLCGVIVSIYTEDQQWPGR